MLSLFAPVFGVARAVAEAVETAAPEVTALVEGAEEVAADGGLLGTIIGFLPLLAFAVILYFMMIRPQRKKDKKEKEMRENIKVGDRVTTIGGIHGTVSALKDDNITIAVGKDKVQLVFAKWAIRNVDDVTISTESETLV